ncbi:MAG: extradiol dioxygenase [SAR324 cluster bacterium]|nr:extradiol dioxygenase [SAR324 cluster bacterium]
MITGAHSIIYSKDAEADKKFLKDVLKLPNVDAGHGWLIFGLPPSEIAFHPSEKNNVHELYFICDDIKIFNKNMSVHNIECEEIKDEGWGLLTKITLPSGGKIGVYEPRHARLENPN